MSVTPLEPSGDREQPVIPSASSHLPLSPDLRRPLQAEQIRPVRLSTFNLQPSTPLLCLSRSLWPSERAAHRNRYQLLTRFARQRPVLLLECPFELATLARPRAAKLRALREALAGPRRQPEGLATLRPLAWWLRDGDPRAWRLNLALYRPWLARAIRLLGQPPAIWIYDHRLWPLLDGAPRAAAAYHCTEDYAGIAGRAHGPAVAEWVAAQERELLRRVDVVFAVSEGLAAPRRALHPRVQTLLNGVDLRLYRPDAACVPACAGLRDLPGPLLGYVGALNYRIDFPLLEAVAERFADGSLVLIGGHEEAADDPAFRRLAARANVHLLGHQPPDRLAALIAHLDVCLMPFVADEWFVRAAQPLKTFEYLACGKPVVSTWLPNLEPWSDLIALTRDPASFLAACAEALAADSPARVASRLAAAGQQSWEARFAEVAAALQAVGPP
jgi:glycosyltransferase involved in cell wall biosynthesis